MATVDEICRRIAGDIGAPVALRVSLRARRVALRVDAAARRVELVVPRGVSARTALSFLSDKRAWVASRLAQLPARAPFVEGAVVPVFDVPHRIVRAADPAAPFFAVAGGEIRVCCDPGLLPEVVRAGLVIGARDELSRRARTLAPRVGRDISRVSVRDTKSRWGSCSARARLSFSWRLVFAPETVVDAVVAHEVAHLVEMNHGPRFWRLLDGLAPQHRAAQEWLQRHRARLLAYG